MSQRRPQARSLETRRRLHNATIETIDEVGLPRASTPKINQRAGVSNGAQQHHYPTRSELIAAALEELTSTFTAQIDRLVVERTGDELSVTDFMRLIASTADAHERYRRCWVEAMVAARTDDELAEVMRPLDRSKTDRWRDIAARLHAADPDLAADLAELNTYLVRGMVVQSGVHADLDLERLLDLWCSMVEMMLNRRAAQS